MGSLLLTLVLSVGVGIGPGDVARRNRKPPVRIFDADPIKTRSVMDLNGVKRPKGHSHQGKGAKWRGDRGNRDKRRGGDQDNRGHNRSDGGNDHDQGRKGDRGRWGGNDQGDDDQGEDEQD